MSADDWNIARRSTRRRASRRAFTLVEMVVVVAVILILVGIVLPAATAMWNQRRVAEARNTVSGMLMTTRARALQNEDGEAGMFFFLDDDGVQRIAPISRNPNHSTTPVDSRIRTWQTDDEWQNVFTITEGRSYTLPPPMRVVPRYVVADTINSPEVPAYQLFNAVELANEDFRELPNDAEQAQRHRNFFSLVYSSDGSLQLWRDVLIRDIDQDEDSRGDVTGLDVGEKAVVKKHYAKDETSPVDILPGGAPPLIDSLLVDGDIAFNFPSIDGLLVYDDSMFREAGTDQEKRTYLLVTAQPFYVHRSTGTVVRGPVGENVGP